MVLKRARPIRTLNTILCEDRRGDWVFYYSSRERYAHHVVVTPFCSLVKVEHIQVELEDEDEAFSSDMATMADPFLDNCRYLVRIALPALATYVYSIRFSGNGYGRFLLGPFPNEIPVVEKRGIDIVPQCARLEALGAQSRDAYGRLLFDCDLEDGI